MYRPSKRTLVIAIAIVAAALFFPIAASRMGNELKLPLIVAILYLSGEAIRRVSGVDGYGPILMWKGNGGFSLMKRLAERHPRFFRELNDFGLTLCFGIPYSAFVFKGQWRKWAIHSVLVATFFYLIQMGIVQQFDSLRTVLMAIGLALGLAGFGLAFVALHAWSILTTPGTPAGVMPVVPGVTIPFVEGLIAIFIAAVVHELSHGIIALAEKLRLKSSGGIFLSFIPIGAFVEPDEKQFERTQLHKKRRVLVAGSMSNFVVFLIAILLVPILSTALPPLLDAPRIYDVSKNGTAFGVLLANESIVAIGGNPIHSSFELGAVTAARQAGDYIDLSVRDTAGQVTVRRVRLGEGKKLGITLENIPKANLDWLFGALAFLISTVTLTGFLNFALSTINILPLFITDGHRLLQEELVAYLGPKREHDAKLLARLAGFATLGLLVINALPLLR